MFHQVFIYDPTEDEDPSRGLNLEQSKNESPHTVKEENPSESATMGFVQTEDLKIAVKELKSEQQSLISTQQVMKSDTETPQVNLETKNILNVTSCTNAVFPMNQTRQEFILPVADEQEIQPQPLTSSPAQFIIQEPQETTAVQSLGPSLISLLPQPALIGPMQLLSAPMAETGPGIVPATQVLDSAISQASTLKIDPSSCLSDVDMSEEQEGGSTVMINSEIKIENEELPVKSADLEDTQVRQNPYKLQEYNGEKSSVIRCEAKQSSTIKEKGVLSVTDKTDPKLSNPESNKHFRSIINKTLKNKVVPILNQYVDTSDSDREEKYTDDDSDCSDWEEEYSSKINKNQRCKKEISKNSVDRAQINNHIIINTGNHPMQKINEPYTLSDNSKCGLAKGKKYRKTHKTAQSLTSPILRRCLLKKTAINSVIKMSGRHISGLQYNDTKLNPPTSSRDDCDKKDNTQNVPSADDPELPQFPYHCDKCDKYFERVNKYKNHKQRSLCGGYKQKREHQCDFCGKLFKTRRQMETHKNTHTNARPFKCLVCDKCFSTGNSRYMHYKSMHLNKKYRFLCCFCGYVTESLEHLKAHEEEHRLPEGCEAPKPFKCLICGKGFISRWKQQKHNREHRLKKCHQCSDTFKTDSLLIKHKEAVHNIIKTYDCKQCGMQFKSSTQLKGHLKTHSSVLEYFCDVCDKGFKRKTNLQQHMITHSDDRPISCPECGDKFKRITHLKQHTAALHGDGRK